MPRKHTGPRPPTHARKRMERTRRNNAPMSAAAPAARAPKHDQSRRRTVNSAAPRGDAKLRTTQVSNVRALPPAAGSSKRESEMAAVGVLDPFAAFQRQYKTGLPFATNTQPAFGFWTRSIDRASELQWGTTNIAGINYTINPWSKPQGLVAVTLDAAGTTLTSNQVTDPNNAFIVANFETLVVAYQGVRVRNLTPVLTQGGELVIGNVSYADATASNFNDIRSASTTITHANGDPGVIAQASYFGNQSDANSAGPLGVLDYRFNDTTLTDIDPNTRCITIRSMGIQATPQVFEIEIVTYYLGIPFGLSSQIFAPVRYEVSPALVNRLIDGAFSKSPQYCIPRNFIKDDGWDTLWTGVKAIIQDVGLGLIGSAASAVGSAFSGLFTPKRRHLGFQRILALLPPDSYPAFRELLLDNETHADAVAENTKPMLRKVAFTPSEMAKIAHFMCFDDDEALTVTSTSSTTSAASAAGGSKASSAKR